MIETHTSLNQRIIDCLNSAYRIHVTDLTPLQLGADTDASVYKAQSSTGESYFLKLKRSNHSDISSVVQRMLHTAGISEIIPPIDSRYGQATHTVDEYTLIAYPFITGHDGFSQDLTDDQWVALGTTLKRVHGFDVPPSIQNQIRQETYSPQWRRAVRSIYAHIDAGYIPSDEVATQFLTLMEEQQAVILHLVDRAEELANKIQKQSPEFVLCHSDIHAGNVLLADTGKLFIVDWDNPIMAPKERDLMFIGGGVANVWNKPDEEELFYRGYGKTEINKDIVAYYRYERIVEDIAEYSKQLLLQADGGTDRESMYQHCIDMFEPRGVVAIALETDRDL